jgi:hypothetical protein
MTEKKGNDFICFSGGLDTHQSSTKRPKRNSNMEALSAHPGYKFRPVSEKAG